MRLFVFSSWYVHLLRFMQLLNYHSRHEWAFYFRELENEFYTILRQAPNHLVHASLMELLSNESCTSSSIATITRYYTSVEDATPDAEIVCRLHALLPLDSEKYHWQASSALCKLVHKIEKAHLADLFPFYAALQEDRHLVDVIKQDCRLLGVVLALYGGESVEEGESQVRSCLPCSD